MIPHSLFIKNFLSYGDKGQTVSFDPYHLICLSGKNGHGKSALLDALTWAIWGQARKTVQSVKPDQGLLRLGQSDMMVIAEFSCNGQRYRIRREYMNHHNKPYAQLEFGLLKDEQLIPLTDKTIKATQEAIIKTIKLDYEAFCNTVFLRQGASNEFSKKSAKERKELLATILGLHTYEQVRKLALQKIKGAHVEQMHTQNSIQRLSGQIANQEEITKNYAEQKEALLKIQKTIHTHLATAVVLETEKQAFYESQEKLGYCATVCDNTVIALKELYTNLAEQYAEWRTNKKNIATLSTIPIALKKKTTLLASINTQQKLQADTLALKELLLSIKEKKQAYEEKNIRKKTDQEEEQLNRIHSIEKQLHENIFHQTASLKTIAQQEQDIKKISLLVEDCEKNHTSADTIQDMILAMEKTIDKKKTTYQKIIAQGNILASTKKELLHKIEATYDIENPSCPMCEQNLSLARKKFLRTKFEKNLLVITHQLARITKIIPTLKNLIVSQHETLNTAKKEELACTKKQEALQELTHKKLLIEMQIADSKETLEKHTQDIRTLTKELLEKKEAYLALEKSLKQDPIYLSFCHQIEQLTIQLAQQAYNQETHYKALQELEAVQKLLALSENAQTLLMHDKELQGTLAKSILHIRETKKTDSAQKRALADQKKAVASLSAVHEKIIIWQKEHESLTHQKEDLIRTTTSLLHQVEQHSTIRAELVSLEQIIASCSNTIEDYSAIALATGKDGIQALLIEEAIPAIEAEANKLLAKLTQNNARIFIDSLKDLKNGGTKETLDIKIADNAGIRPYELFSGGEAFRIDFALRIAVSTLLAQRAGTSLQTLIIDEGFGSQDEEGLSLIMSTLYKIQDNFAKIIIVSHLPTMKDQFPVHFTIDKGNHGSVVKVIELG